MYCTTIFWNNLGMHISPDPSFAPDSGTTWVCTFHQTPPSRQTLEQLGYAHFTRPLLRARLRNNLGMHISPDPSFAPDSGTTWVCTFHQTPPSRQTLEQLGYAHFTRPLLRARLIPCNRLVQTTRTKSIIQVLTHIHRSIPASPIASTHPCYFPLTCVGRRPSQVGLERMPH